MAQLHLNKFNGAGNSFLIVDLISPEFKKINHSSLKKSSRVRWAKSLCDIHWGIGADGFIVLEQGHRKKSEIQNVQKVKWDFYNADGSRAEMCGNAARCVGHYLSLKYKKTDFLIQTSAGVVRSTVIHLSKNKIDADVDVTMTLIHELELGLRTTKNFKLNHKKNAPIEFDFINSGVPHAVVHFPDLKSFFSKKFKSANIYNDMTEIVKHIRSEKRFLKHGTNVTFLSPIGKNKILSLTFERGVPSFTLACGTGAVAAAVSFLNGAKGIVKVQVPGGHLVVPMIAMAPRLIGTSKHMAEFVVTV